MALTISAIRAAASGTVRPSGRATADLDGAFGGGDVDDQVAAEQRFPIQIAKHQVGIGYGRLCAPGAIARRARIGPGTVRPDPQRASWIDPGNAAATGADLGQVDHRHADRVAGAVLPAVGVAGAADFVFRGHRDLAIGDDAGFRRRAAHVEGDHVRQAKLASRQGRRDDAGGGSGFDDGGGHAQRLGDVDDPAAGAHDVQIGQSKRGRRLLQPIEITRQQRPDISANGSRAGAFEFADFRQHVAGQEYPDVRQRGAQ